MAKGKGWLQYLLIGVVFGPEKGSQQSLDLFFPTQSVLGQEKCTYADSA